MIYLSNKKIPNKFWYKEFDLLKNSVWTFTKFVKINKTIYCGRPSILENPFSYLDKSIAKYKCTKENCILKFEEYIRNLPKTSKQIQLIEKLKIEKDSQNICLECWCKPNDCHLNIIYKMIYE